MKVLVTGAAGFIGFWTSQKLLAHGHEVFGLDNLNDYYDVSLKEARLKILSKNSQFKFFKTDVAHTDALNQFFKENKPHRVIHLAAQAGVRYSIKNPYSYVESNLLGFLNILECCRHHQVESLVYASTSSVYGSHENMPFSESQSVDHPVSFYAATKASNELMAHSYSSMYGIPTTGLRFFTVYGPWGRPDMALFLFTQKILKAEPIDVFNKGEHFRDFTYVDDIVDGIYRVFESGAFEGNPNWDPNHPDPATSSAPYRVFNIGNGKPEPLLKYIEVIEKELGRKAQMNMLPMQKGDVPGTHASVERLQNQFGYQPKTSIEEGIKKFIAWYREYYRA